jgi:hypothetical protein
MLGLEKTTDFSPIRDIIAVTLGKDLSDEWIILSSYDNIQISMMLVD